MKRDICISNEEKFGLYARLYYSMGLDVTFINGFFGHKNILRIFSVDELFKYYDNEIYGAYLGRTGNVFWIIFKYKKNGSPIFKNDVEKLGIEQIHRAWTCLNEKNETDYSETALRCSGYFCYKNRFRFNDDDFDGWSWWSEAVICEYKDLSTNKIQYQVLHKDELQLNDTDEIDHTLSQYDYIQLFKRPISYFRQRKYETEEYKNAEWKTYNWAKATGIGVISGGNSYRCIDIDGCHSLEFLNKILNALSLDSAYRWVIKTGSCNGFHIWIKTKKLPANLLMSSQAEKLFKNAGFIVFEPNKDYKDTFKRIELRWNCHVVMPPSISGYGFNYQFVNGLPMYEPKEIPSEKLLEVLERFGFNTSLNHENIIKNIIMDIGPSVRRYSVYQTLILAFDIETTGLAKNLNASYEDVENWPYIVQIGYQIISGFGQEVIKEGDYILRPKGFTIPESSTSIHGISNSDALNNGWNRRDFYIFFVEQLRHIHYLVVHNSDFDINVLKCELLRYTDLSKDEINHLFNKLRIICTMKKSTELCKIKRSEYSDEYKYPSLNELYKFLFGKKIEDAHNAKNDARATVDCFIELSKKGIIRYCKNKPIYLNFWSENEYCTCCYGKLKQSSCPIPEWDWDGVILECEECGMLYIAGVRTDDELYF